MNELDHPFYKRPIQWQWAIAVVLVLVGFIPAIYIIELGYDQPLYYLLFYIYLPIGQFCFTPLLKLAGMYRYYSPMLLGYNPSDQQIEIHNGTSFDYLFMMRHHKSGAALRHQLLAYYLEGLLNIIQQIEQGQIPETVEVTGTSYFFSDRSAERFGFQLSRPSWWKVLNIYSNFIDLTWMYSISRGKFTFPRLGEVRTAKISGKDLLQHKTIIERYHQVLKGRQL
jgi:hypothetical protein